MSILVLELEARYASKHTSQSLSNKPFLHRASGLNMDVQIPHCVRVHTASQQKRERDESTKGLSCWRKVVIKKDWKTSLLHLLFDYATDVE